MNASLKLARQHPSGLVWRTALVETPTLTFHDIRCILDGVTPKTDVEINRFAVVVNLQHAWEYLFDHADDHLDFHYVREYNRVLGQGIVADAGRLRSTGIHVGSYIPPIPRPDRVVDDMSRALAEPDTTRRALRVYKTICRGQWFMDGNKRTAAMAANHILVHEDAGLFALPATRLGEYARLLADYYETDDSTRLTEWLEYHALVRTGDGLTDAQRDGVDEPDE